ncbi:MAG: hypothetical protein Q9225_007594 [Loekoesia sp. 1 TL-2023]
MEHLPLPKDVASPGPGPVPYVCKEEYDEGPFLTYPTRRKGSNALGNETEMVNTDLNRVLLEPVARLEAFIQTWLFFGLLREVFGELFAPAQFVVTTASTSEPQSVSKTSQVLSGLKNWLTGGPRKVLNTGQLVPMVETWMNRTEASKDPKDARQTQYEHIAACLQLTSTALRAVRPAVRPDFNPWIRLSVASIGELLTQATNQAYGIENLEKDNRCPGNWRLLYDEPQSIAQMKSNGLCPYEIHRIRNLFLTIQTYHFLTWMKKAAPGTRHRHCTERECLANYNDLGQYIAKHRDDTCRCDNYFIDISEVIRILSRRSLPLLRILPGSTLNDIRVDVVEASPSLKYVALSHVWADGLGNPHSNSLPKCQLQRLFQLTRSFSKMEDDEGMLFWIDTLCCPVGPPQAKAMALNQMKVPYIGASHVLVFESSLREVESSRLDPTEVCLRIFTSGWMRRLWTLQEGALPRNLWFQFKDSAVELRQVWLKVIKIHNTEIGRRGLSLDITVLHQSLRHFFHAEKADREISLDSVDQAIQFRSLSVASDEPLLIGGLLSLDTAHILDGPEGSRMQRLWSLMPSAPRGIPKNILFSRGPRLCQLGFRWAPASLLTTRGGQDGRLRSTDVEYSAGHLTPAGLQVRLPAFQIAMASAPKGLPKNPWNAFSQPDENNILCRNVDGKWFLLYSKYGDPKKVDQDLNRPSLHTILKKGYEPQTLLLESAFQFGDSPENISGLLVHDDGNHQDSTSKVISDMIVVLGMQQGTSETLLEAAYQASRTLLNDEITTEYTKLAIEDEKDQKEHPAYANLEPQFAQKLFDLAENIDDQNIQAAIKIHNSRGTKTFFPVLIASAYLGLHCDLGPMLPSNTKWCVD